MEIKEKGTSVYSNLMKYSDTENAWMSLQKKKENSNQVAFNSNKDKNAFGLDWSNKQVSYLWCVR